MSKSLSQKTPPFVPPQWPATTPEMRKLSKIKPYKNNPRVHPPAQITMLAGIMTRRGVDQPIVVDEAGVILKGHGRRLAAIEAGFTEYPVVVHRGLSEADKSAMRIEDNQVALLAGWDPGLIKLEVESLKLSGYKLESLGFGPAELIQFLGEPVTDPSREWNGMPGFQSEDKTAFRSLVIHFKDQVAVDKFAKLIKQKITPSTRFAWFPEIEIERYADKVYK